MDAAFRLATVKTFQSTLPARGATFGSARPPNSAAHFNPRSPHGERPIVSRVLQIIVTISIHAPRTGSDGRVGVDGRQPDISIHAPRTGSDAQNQSCL